MTSLLDREYDLFSFRERVCILRESWSRIYNILDSFCSGYLGIRDELFNNFYTKLCLLIEQVLSTPGMDTLEGNYQRPFHSLHDITEIDMDWELLQPIIGSYRGDIEEAYIRAGEGTIADRTIQDLLYEVDKFITAYRIKKKMVEKRWLAQIEKVSNQDQSSQEVPRMKLGFIK